MPTSRATLARVDPNPARAVGTTSASGMRVAIAVAKLTSTRATNACSFKVMIRKSRTATAPAAMSNSGIVARTGSVSGTASPSTSAPGA